MADPILILTFLRHSSKTAVLESVCAKGAVLDP